MLSLVWWVRLALLCYPHQDASSGKHHHKTSPTSERIRDFTAAVAEFIKKVHTVMIFAISKMPSHMVPLKLVWWLLGCSLYRSTFTWKGEEFSYYGMYKKAVLFGIQCRSGALEKLSQLHNFIACYSWIFKKSCDLDHRKELSKCYIQCQMCISDGAHLFTRYRTWAIMFMRSSMRVSNIAAG